MIQKIKDLFHIHNFNNPIVSAYVSFHRRNIIYECRCGKRKSRLMNALDIPILTSSISKKEFKIVLENKSPYKLHKINKRVIFVEQIKK